MSQQPAKRGRPASGKSRYGDPRFTSIAARIPVELKKKLKIRAIEEGRSVQEVMESALDLYLKKRTR